VIDGAAPSASIRLAQRWWQRAIGLLATPRLDNPAGLWIAPCSSIHTVGMRYPIDVVFIARDGIVLRVVERVPPLRFVFGRGAHATLELRAGLAREWGVAVGSRVELLGP
jgi:uncharacterized protein